MSSSLIASRSISGRTSSSFSAGEVLGAHRRQVAARALDPHDARSRGRCGRSAMPFAEVLPPPKFATARSAPSRCEASTSRPSVVVRGPVAGHRSSTGSMSRRDGAHRRQLLCSVVALRGHALGVARRAQGARRVLGRAEPRARPGAQRAHVGAEGVEQRRRGRRARRRPAARRAARRGRRAAPSRRPPGG